MPFGSNLKISNSKFSDQISNMQGGFLYALGGSSVSVNLTSFIKGSAGYGGAIYIDSSTLQIDSSLFKDNIGTVSGGNIYATNTNINVFNTSFIAGLSLQGDIIYMDSQTLKISNSVFQGPKTTNNASISMIYAVSCSSIIIQSSSFSSPAHNISALVAVTVSNINISDSLFRNLYGTTYGAVSCTGGTGGGGGRVNILRTRFINNSSPNNGGGLLVQDLGLNIRDSIVQGNYAAIDGGGMHLTSPNCKTCYFNISGVTNITDNVCLHDGGAIKFADSKPSIDATVIIQNNSASYGGNFAGIPCSIKPQSRRRLDESANFIKLTVAPGQIFTIGLNISLLDTYGKVITSDSSSTLTINTMSSDLSLRGNDIFTANQGVFIISNFIPSGPIGSYQNMSALTSAISNSKILNDNSTYSNSLIIELFLRNCTLGEQITPSECIVCQNGTLLLDPESVCLACPTGGYCPGGTDLIPLPGYWRDVNPTTTVYACLVAGACIGYPTNTDLNKQCSPGYEGIMCSSCMEGYTKTASGYCDVCPSQDMNFGILLTIMAVILVFCIILVKTTIKSSFSKKELYSVYLKIFTNYLQLMSLTSGFNFKWPSYVTKLFNIQEQAVSGTTALFSVQCYLHLTGNGSNENSYYYELILIAILPLVIYFVSGLVWLGISFQKVDYSCLKRELFLTYNHYFLLGLSKYYYI